jgi:two-component system, LytTR family, response regulator
VNDLQKLIVPTTEGYLFIDHRDIIMLKANDTYTHIYTDSEKQPVISSKTLKHYEEELNGGVMMRVHQSYIVNLTKIKKYIRGDGTYLLLENRMSVPVTRKDELKERLGIKK